MNPQQRAEAAQVDFGETLVAAPRNRKEVRVALLSVLSTAELAARNDHGISVSRGHKNLQEQNPKAWNEIELEVWASIKKGWGVEDVFKIVRPFVEKRYEFKILDGTEILKRLRNTG